MRESKFDLPLRTVVEAPVPGVTTVLQWGASGKAERVQPAVGEDGALVFDFTVVVDGALPDGRPRLLGPCVQGPPTGRFVYLCIGQAAGQGGSPWSRRAKVPLAGIDWALIEALPLKGRLVARFNGRGRDGSPACATVALMAPGWTAS